MTEKPTILLLGKLPPPFIGPAIATRILLGSALRDRYRLLHLNTVAVSDFQAIGRWRSIKLWRHAVLYARLVRLLARERPDLVLVPISQSTWGFLKDAPYVMLSRFFGSATVIQLRGSNLRNWLAASSPVTRTFAGLVLRSAQGAVVLGETLRPLFAEYQPTDRIFVVPNGADYHMPPRRPSPPDAPVRILYLANLMRTKGIEDVLEAAHLLTSRCRTPFHLDVVGAWLDVDIEASCRALAERHPSNVTFHPPARDVDKFRHFVDADVFVFTPRAPEGHPWVIVEALAAGLPIIATDRGAIAESVHDGVNGFIVEAANPAQIADRMQALLEDASLRRRMGAAGRTLYAQQFTESRMVERLQSVIDAVLDSTARPKVGRPVAAGSMP